MTPRCCSCVVGLRAFVCCVALASVPLAQARVAWGQRDLTDIPSTDPAVELASFQVAEGFQVELFASDPDIAKPIQMNFDPAGRLWVASSSIYPHIEPGQEASDRILVLEDTNGDGRADKTTVFAEGLLIPTGIAPGDGGAYVGNSTELLHLMDTDGDGQADRRRVMLSGFGTEDTHHIVHTFRWGPDGMLYFNQSIYIHSHLETPHGVRRLGGGGIWQFRPETMELEVFLRGLINPWGHHFTRDGQSFITDGAGSHGINYGFPGATFVTSPGAVRIIDGLNPGSPKFCGLEVVSGRHLPDDWQGNLITNDFRGHRVCRFILSDDGSGYAAREQVELIKTDHVAFRPVDVKMGPDGAIYIADWYNPIIQHGEVDFRDPRRDHAHGHIWRMTAVGRPLVDRPNLVEASTRELFAALDSPEGWTREQARRVLKEHSPAILPELGGWVATLDPAEENSRLEALWVYQSLNVAEPELLASLLRAENHGVRAAATRALGQWAPRLRDTLPWLEAQVADEHPRVRLEALHALARVRERASVELALRVLDEPMDRFLDYALWYAVRELEDVWLPDVLAGHTDLGGAGHLEFALRALGTAEAVPPLLALYRAGRISPDREQDVLSFIAQLGEPEDLRLVFDEAVGNATLDARQRASLLAALSDATRRRRIRPDGDLAGLASLVDQPDQSLQAAAVEAVGLWRVGALHPRLTQLAGATGTSEEVRDAAIAALGLFGGAASRMALEQLASHAPSLATRAAATKALATLDVTTASKAAGSLLTEGDASIDVAALVGVLVERKEGAAALAAAIGGRQLSPDVAKLALRTASGAAQPDMALLDALRAAGGLTAGPRTLSPEQMKAMVADVSSHGDAARGERIFRREDLACFKCHAIAGAGGRVGPDLVSIGASAQVDYLIESILEPGKAIKENYHSLILTTLDGRALTGIKIRESNDEIVLLNAEDAEVIVPRDSIDEMVPGRSLMPDGQADALTRDELVDLVRFLSELGKLGPYTVGKDRVVRRWEVWQSTPEGAERIRRTSLHTAADDDPALTWAPAYSTVAGLLPIADVEAARARNSTRLDSLVRLARIGFVRFQLDVTTPGEVALGLNSIDGLVAWLDGDPIDVESAITLELPRGLHTVTLAIDIDEATADLRCELRDVPGSPARAQIVSGK